MQSTQKNINRKTPGKFQLFGALWPLLLVFVLSAGTAKSSEFVNPERYLVGPGDTFTVNFVDANLLALEFSVSIEGVATIPNVGTFELVGSSLAQAKLVFIKALNSQYSGSKFDIALSGVRTKQMLVAGAVNKPGLYEVSATTLVSDLINEAKGLADGASRRNIVLRGGVGEVPVDLSKFIRTGDLEANPPVYLGDVLFVPLYTDSSSSQYVSGKVRNPGAFEFTGRDKISDLISLAGGLSALGRLDSVIVFNGAGVRSIMPIDSDSLLGSQSRVMVLPLDRVSRTGDVTITGEVRFSGRYPYGAGMNIAHLIELAGGVTPEAYRSGVTIYNTRSARDKESDSLFSFEKSTRTVSGFASPIGLAGRSSLRVSGVFAGPSPFGATVMLLQGDSVYVPRFEGLVNIIGQVARPGTVEFSERSSIGSLLNQAGGLTNWADMSRSYVRRKNGGWSVPLSSAGRIFDGDMIFVARKAETPPGGFLRTLRDLSLIGAGVALTALAVDELSK